VIKKVMFFSFVIFRFCEFFSKTFFTRGSCFSRFLRICDSSQRPLSIITEEKNQRKKALERILLRSVCDRDRKRMEGGAQT